MGESPTFIQCAMLHSFGGPQMHSPLPQMKLLAWSQSGVTCRGPPSWLSSLSSTPARAVYKGTPGGRPGSPGPGVKVRGSSRGLPEDDEGIADFQSLGRSADEEEDGYEGALQYGVGNLGSASADQFFSTDTRVTFGINALEIAVVELQEIGLQRPLMVTGWNQARSDPILWELLPRRFDVAWYSVSTEPSLSDVAKGAQKALEHRADCVIAVGGAAVLDAGKAIAGLAYAGEDCKSAARRLVDVAREPRETSPGIEDEQDPLLGAIPLITIPMVPGLGSEVTPMAIILDDGDPLEPQKVTIGFRNTAAALPCPFMAIVEPRLYMSLPLELTWARAFAALAGCLEGFLAGRGFVPDLLSHQGIERVSRCLTKELGARGLLYTEREDIGFAGVIRGLVAPRDGWSLLHQLASAVSVACGAPYALCVARLFPRALEAQITRLRREEEEDLAVRARIRPRRGASTAEADESSEKDEATVEHDAAVQDDGDPGSVASAMLSKYRQAACYVTSSTGAAPEDMVPWLDECLLDKNILPLCQSGLRPGHVSTALQILRGESGGVAGTGSTGNPGSTGRWSLDEDIMERILLEEASTRIGSRSRTRALEKGGEGAIEVDNGGRTVVTGP